MKTKPHQVNKAAERRDAAVEQAPLRVSFEFVDWQTEAFFVHGFDAEFYVRLFDCLQSIQSCTEEQLSRQNHPSLKCKPIFKSATGTYRGFPQEVIDRIAGKLRGERSASDPLVEAVHVAKMAFEVSMGKNQGRLHGFLWDKAFNLVWFDPAHNLYPGHDRVLSVRDVMRVKSGSHEQLLGLKGAIEQLLAEKAQITQELNELMEAWAAR
ncbi:hypothetical protein [Roseateles sp.]|jgi:hypothetical protein|uniref:hypothetical protein n=1 Tax=Roseateles sp. TaxID=1971397 RepID=UPI0031DF0D6C